MKFNRIIHKGLSAVFAVTLAVGGLSFSANAKIDGTIGKANDGIDFNALVGNQVYFGTYDHAIDLPNFIENKSASTLGAATKEGVSRPVLWRVMGEENGDGKLTLFSKHVLDTRAFSASGADSYSTSDLRKWLNGEFIQNNFQVSEQSSIADTKVTVPGYSVFDWSKGTRTPETKHNKVLANEKLYLPAMNYIWSANSIDEKYSVPFNPQFRNGKETFAPKNNGGGEYMLSIWARADHPNDSHALRVDSYTVNIKVNPKTFTKIGEVTLISTGNLPSSYFGIQPLVKLDPKKIIFTSAITKQTKNYIVGGNPFVAEYETVKPETQTVNYKLTLVADKVKLSKLTQNGKPISGQTITLDNFDGRFTLTGVADGHDKLAYKIVQNVNGNRKIVAYGAGNKTKLLIDTAGLFNGTSYTVYVWAQKDNVINSNEASVPISFTLKSKATPTKPH